MTTSGDPPGATGDTTGADLPRRVDLGSGRQLVVREAGPQDAAGLTELYASLSEEDRRRRFFSIARPSKRFIERWASIGTRGGLLLVAEVHEADGTTRLVGDAGYSPLDDDDGELAITVAPGWRGWLGPYLLAALLEAAAGRGVHDLEAVVLLENKGMMALARSRGFAVVDHPDWSTVRLRLATGGPVPSWPARHDRPRVLVEVPGGRWWAEDEAREAGLDVITCPGPSAFPCGHCPVLEGKPCPLAQDADVIVFALPASAASSAAVLDGHRRLHATTPVEIDAPRRSAAALIELLRRLTWQAPTSGGDADLAAAHDPADVVRREELDG